MPLGHVEAGVLHPVGHLAADRDLHAEQVVARGGEDGDLVEGLVEIRLGDRRAEPGPAGLAEQVQELAPRDPVRVHPLDGRAGQAGRLGLGDGASIGFPEQLGLEGEVDRAGGDIHRELLRLQVVFEQRHREGQGHAAPESVVGTREPAVDRPAGKWPAVAVHAVHPEQAQQRTLLSQGGRCAGAGAPGAGQRLGAVGQPVDRVDGRGRGTHAAKDRGPGSATDGHGQPVHREERAKGHQRVVGAETDGPIADALRPGQDRRVVGEDAQREIDLHDDRRPDLEPVHLAERGAPDGTFRALAHAFGGHGRVHRCGRMPAVRGLDHDPLRPGQPVRHLLGQRVVAGHQTDRDPPCTERQGVEPVLARRAAVEPGLDRRSE